MVDLRHLVAADPAWRAVFEDDSLIRVLAWAVAGDDGEIVGLVIDPNDPARIVAAPQAVTTEGFSFSRYGFRPDVAARQAS